MDRICTGLVQPPPIRNFLDIIPSASTDGTATYKNVNQSGEPSGRKRKIVNYKDFEFEKNESDEDF